MDFEGLNVHDPHPRYRMRKRRASTPVLERMAPKINFLAPAPEYAPHLGSCWVWTGCLSAQGYGQASLNSKNALVHRISYAAHYGQIPEGLYIDHLCRNRACCNPCHLEAVTQRENNLRGTSPAADNAKKTHCDNGHPLSGENLIREGQWYRRCKICRNAAKRKGVASRSEEKKLRDRVRSREHARRKRLDPAFRDKINAKKREVRKLKKLQNASA